MKEEKKGIYLKGATVVLTGSFKCGRDELKRAIITEGALVHGAVRNNTDYVVVGEDAGIKLIKAREMGVPCLSEDEMVTELRRLGHRLPIKIPPLPFLKREPVEIYEDGMNWLQSLGDCTSQLYPYRPVDLNADRSQIEQLGRSYMVPDMSEYRDLMLYGKTDMSEAIRKTIHQLHSREMDTALANTIASIMVQLGVDTLEISDEVREKVQQGNYMVSVDRHPKGVVFTVQDTGTLGDEKHDLWKDGDEGIPDVILDRNGEVVLDLCKRCGRGEQQLLDHSLCHPRKD